MPNKNYIAGRRAEYKVMALLKKDGYTVIRASGSHGPFDVVGIRPVNPKQYRMTDDIILVQVKRVSKKGDTAIMNMGTKFTNNPPLPYSLTYLQCIMFYNEKGWHSTYYVTPPKGE